MLGACKLNNKSMRNLRREPVYQCMAIDLAMLGVISKEECEMLLGSGIPKNLTLPNGKQGSLLSESELTAMQSVVVSEPSDSEPSDGEPSEDKD